MLLIRGAFSWQKGKKALKYAADLHPHKFDKGYFGVVLMSQLGTLIARSSVSGLNFLIKSIPKKSHASATKTNRHQFSVRAMSSEVDAAAKAAASG